VTVDGHRRRVAVIGGGVIGCAVLWELARNGIEAILLEVEPDIGEGASKANSGILHTGFDSRPGTLESRLLRRASELWPDVLASLSVPYLPLGAVMVARTPDEQERIVADVVPNAGAVGVTTEVLDAAAVRDLAPFVVDSAAGGLFVPDEAVVDPFWLTRAFAEAAMAANAEVRTATPVIELALAHHGIRLTLGDGSSLHVDQVFDCAGLHADEIARRLGDHSFRITPRKGQFLVSEETFGVDRIVLPVPGTSGKGMLVTPIAFGGLLLGPTASDQSDKDDRSTDPATRERILSGCSTLVPRVREMDPVRSFAGLRTVSSSGDYVICPSGVSDRLFIVAGIRSTGISASPAIAELAVREAMRLRGWRPPAVRRPIQPPPIEERAPGEVICLCRSISCGEVEAVCDRPIAPRTLDGIKRRSGAMFGDCQGNLCSVNVAGVVAARHGTSAESIAKGAAGSWMFRRGPAVPPDRPPARLPTAPSGEVAIVGGGLAGVGAALVLRAAGVAAVVIERRGELMRPVGRWTKEEVAHVAPLDVRPDRGLDVRLRTTAVGLVPEDGRWRVLTQGAGVAAEVVASAVIVATGGYVQPAEHRSIAGPRLAGVCTADLVLAALERGLLPGQRAVVVGGGRFAECVTGVVRDAGCEIVAVTNGPVDEVRGRARLDAVRVAGRWLNCDTLVFADRLLAGPFILRGLGLVDARPGVPAPARADGTLPLPGLWAVGTCVTPDIDHRHSLRDGLRVGAAVVEALRVAGERG
jgi:glycerol-3-phosphate dehydrogenase